MSPGIARSLGLLPAKGKHAEQLGQIWGRTQKLRERSKSRRDGVLTLIMGARDEAPDPT
jgi:hypothetical protein